MRPTKLQEYLDSGHPILRREWAKTDEHGRQLLCLYTALAGDPSARPSSCPASLCPKWLALLLPWMNDATTLDVRDQHVVPRLAACAGRLSQIQPETEWRVRAAIVREAMRHTDRSGVLSACERVAWLCERRGRGESVPDEDFAAAHAAAHAARRGTTAAHAARAAAHAAGHAAGHAAADRIARAVLDEIERDLLT